MLTVTYDNSDKDLPAICVMQVDMNAKYKCLKMEIGEQAELLYKALTDQSFNVGKTADEDKIIKRLEKLKGNSGCDFQRNSIITECICEIINYFSELKGE